MGADVEQVWAWLGQVPDPEIPVLSLVDLGVIREVAWEGKTLKVAISPTYTGCPATSVIAMDVEAALRGHGIGKIELERRLSPPWSTDWISEEGRRKLRDYGIAPPESREAARARKLLGEGPQADCPRCGSTDTEEVSRFGSTPCKAAWRCRACLEPFDRFKCI